MSGYSIGWGMPRMHCGTCGGRVGNALCHRHEPSEPGLQILWDRYIPLRLLRVAAKTEVAL